MAARSIEEIATEIFGLYDTDKNKAIDKKELLRMIQDTYEKMGIKRDIDEAEVKATLSVIDSNNDGTISLEEYIRLMKKSYENVPQQH